MLDNLNDFEGTPLECAELLQAQKGVRQWMVSASRWGRPEPEIDPAPPMSDQPGIEKTNTEVTPSPSRRRISIGQCYGLNSKGNKSHRPTIEA